MRSAPACPLCENGPVAHFFKDPARTYLRCSFCELIFASDEHHLSPAEEKAEYDLHENSPDDPGYRAFLNRLLEPLLEFAPPGGRGLDFGCGPGPTLSVMLEEKGFAMELYDPLYAPDRSVLSGPYDFITATETLEHLKNPRRELELLVSLLKPGGVLGIMTQLSRGPDAFSAWRYKDDRTHIAFYSEKTMAIIAALFGLEIVHAGRNEFIFRGT